LEEGSVVSKRAARIDTPEIGLDRNTSVPLHRQLYERLRRQILSGQLEPDTRLPSTRVLASALGIARNTAALAYEQLLLEGFIQSRIGDGTRVAPLYVEQLRGTQAVRELPPQATLAPHAAMVGRRGQLLVDHPLPEDRYAGRRPFSIGQPDVAHFPYDVWAKLVARHARHSLRDRALYQPVQGYEPLCEAIAAHIGLTRGVHCSADQIIMTAGSQGALDLIARVVLDPGDAAWVEDPGYSGARGALLAAGARLTAVPVDREGIDVATGQALCVEARLAVVTPSHQFPTGVTMSLRRRLALLDWASATHAWIVEDDYDSEHRFSGRPLEALHGLDSAGQVIYVGTFSKVLFPALRLGYLVAPRPLLLHLRAARRLVDIHLPLLDQLALADFMTEGHFARYVRKMRLRYLERRNALIDALARDLGDLLEVTVPEAGLHMAAWLSPEMSARAGVASAAARELHIPLLSQFSLRPLTRDGFLLGFVNATPDELCASVGNLARALRVP
jgi:GntR family transcriptional regulator/MocR family aminotransferase